MTRKAFSLERFLLKKFSTEEKGMRTDQELQFSVGGVDSRPAFDPMEYVKYQISFPTKATILEFAIGADLPVEFEKPGPVDLVFIGSSVA